MERIMDISVVLLINLGEPKNKNELIKNESHSMVLNQSNQATSDEKINLAAVGFEPTPPKRLVP